MATKALLTVEDFVRLSESVGDRDVRCELAEEELPMEFAVEAQRLLGGSLEGSVG